MNYQFSRKLISWECDYLMLLWAPLQQPGNLFVSFDLSVIPHKNIILAVTGGIAAYKSAILVRRLKDAGFDVRVVMTHGAQAFITPSTF